MISSLSLRIFCLIFSDFINISPSNPQFSGRNANGNDGNSEHSFGLFGFVQRLSLKNRSEVTFSEYDLLDRIEKDINQGTYMLYAQRRFAKDVGTRNVKVADDDFTKWLFSISKEILVKYT